MAKLSVTLHDESWEFDFDDLDLGDLFVIKGTLGLGLQPFLQGIDNLDPDCIQTLVWFLKRKSEPALRRDGVTFRIKDLKIKPLNEDPTTSPSETLATDGTDTSTSCTDGADSTLTPSTG